MAFEIEATYEDGVLRPDQPLPLQDHERVIVSVTPTRSRARQRAGSLRWTGDPEILRRIAEDPIESDGAGAS